MSSRIAAEFLLTSDTRISITDPRLDPKPYFYIDRAVSKQFLKQFQGALADIDEAIHLSRDHPYLPIIRESIICRAQLPMNQEDSQEK